MKKYDSHNPKHLANLSSWLRTRINTLEQKKDAEPNLAKKVSLASKCKGYKECYEYIFNDGKLMSIKNILKKEPKKVIKSKRELLTFEEIENL